MPRQQRLQLTEFGLNTIVGDLQAGPGALRVAHNVVIPAAGRAEKVRGFFGFTKKLPFTPGPAPSLTGGGAANSVISSKTLGQKVLINSGLGVGSPSVLTTGALWYGDGVTHDWWDLTTPDGRTFLNDSYTRQKHSVNQKTLFLTTQRTPIRIEADIETAATRADALAQVSYAGMPQSPGIAWQQQTAPELVDVSAAVNWLANGQFVAYRFVWGVADADGTRRLSPPSGRYILGNVPQVSGYDAGATLCPSLHVQLPYRTETLEVGLDVAPASSTHRRWFLQAYRSQVMAATAGGAPDDELQLCYEAWVTSVDVENGYITFSDTCPPAGLTTALYTNQVLGGDVNSGVLVAGNTGLGLASKNDRPPIAKDTALFADCTFWANFTTPYRLTLSLLGVQADGGGPFVGAGSTITFSDFNGGTFTLTGVTGTPATEDEFHVETAYSSIALNIRQTAMNLVAALNTSSWLLKNALVGVYNGNDASPGTIGQFYVETVQQEWNPNTITDPLGNIGASSDVSGWLPSQEEVGENTGWKFVRDDAPNGLAISKPFQGDAVPPVNYLRVGRSDTVIQRIIPTTNALYILCDDGVYWLRGTAPTNFQIERLDPTCRIWFRESACALNDSVFLWAREGLFQIQNGSVIRIDTPIRGTIESVRFNNDNSIVLRSNFAWANPFDNTVTWGWANWDTAADGAGGSPFQAFVWNANTNSWSTRQMNVFFNGGFRTALSCATARWSDGAIYAGAPHNITAGGYVLSDVSTGSGIGQPVYYILGTGSAGAGGGVAYPLEAAMEWVTSVPNPGSICHWSEFQAFSQPGSVVYSAGNADLNLAYSVNEVDGLTTFNPAFPIVDKFGVVISSEVQAAHTSATVLPASTQGRCYIATPGGYAVRQMVRITHTTNAAGNAAGCAFTGFALVYRAVSGRTTR